MCGRYDRRSDKQRIADSFKLGKLPDDFILPPDYNVVPTTFRRKQRSASSVAARKLAHGDTATPSVFPTLPYKL